MISAHETKYSFAIIFMAVIDTLSLRVMESISFDRVAGIYDKTRGLPPKTMEKVVQKIAHELKDCRKILDAGCGTGRFAKPLQALGFEVVGIDISAKMLEKAKEKGAKNLLLSDVCFLPFTDSSFDAAISIHVLHLVRGWKIALRDMVRVTRNFLLTCAYTAPNPLNERYRELLKDCGYEKPTLGTSEAELKNLVKPLKSMLAVSRIPFKADETLAILKDKVSAFQFEVPNDLHRHVMKKLMHQWAGKTYHRNIEILVWDIACLKTFLHQH